MPDITMCNNGRCKDKENCYRFMAIPNPHKQSYFTGKPSSEIDGTCKAFVKISDEYRTILNGLSEESEFCAKLKFF